MKPDQPRGATPPAQRWYRKRAGGRDGPWSAEQLLAGAAAGRVSPNDLLKTDAMSEWVAAKAVNGLAFPDRPAGPPPLPSKPRPAPPELPARRTPANVPRPRPVIWGYVGAALVVLTVGLAVAVAALNGGERGAVAPSPDTAREPEPADPGLSMPPPADAALPQAAPPPPPPAVPQQPVPQTTTDPLLVRIRGTRWEGADGAAFEWTADGRFVHDGVERPCRALGLYSVEVEFVAGVESTLVFDPDLTRFDRYGTRGEGSPQSAGRRNHAAPARPAPPSAAAADESAVLRGHEGYVWNVAFSQDGRKLLSLGQRGPVVLWDVATRTRSWTADVPGDLRAVAFFDNERRVAVQNAGGLVVLDARSGAIEDETRFPANGWGKFSPDGRHLALTTVNDSRSRIHAVPSGRVLYEHPTRYATSQRGYAFSRDGLGCYAGGPEVFRLDVTAHPFPVRTGVKQPSVEAMDVSPDRTRLVTGSGRVWVDRLKKDAQGDNCVRVWDIPSGRVVATLHGHGGWLWSVCYHPDGKRVLSGGSGRTEPLDFYGHRPGSDNSLRLWDVAAQRQLAKFEGHAAAVLDIKCSPDGRYAATGSADGTVRLWRLPD